MAPIRFTDELRQAAGNQWTRVVNHRFTKELSAGTIDETVLKKYLIQDHRFLDAFVVLLASMVASARCLEDRIQGCQFLALITGKENTYFERSFQELDCSEAERASIPNDACTSAFIKLMREVASSDSLAEKLAVLLVCEWSYLSWGQTVQPTTKRDNFVMYEWVDLHTGEYFESVVQYLRTLLDKEGEHLDEQQRTRCKERFLEAVNLEEEFFDNAYE